MITREPLHIPDDATWKQRVLLGMQWGIADVGRAVTMGGGALANITVLRRTRGRNEFFRQLYVAGIDSLPVITVVALFIKRGCASATMNSPSTTQRNDIRNPPDRARAIFCMPRTNCTEE